MAPDLRLTSVLQVHGLPIIRFRHVIHIDQVNWPTPER